MSMTKLRLDISFTMYVDMDIPDDAEGGGLNECLAKLYDKQSNIVSEYMKTIPLPDDIDDFNVEWHVRNNCF